jgi:hypothetical protein
MAYPGGVDETAVYMCTGEPLPDDVRTILQQLLNDPFAACFTAIQTTCHTSG